MIKRAYDKDTAMPKCQRRERERERYTSNSGQRIISFSEIDFVSKASDRNRQRQAKRNATTYRERRFKLGKLFSFFFNYCWVGD